MTRQPGGASAPRSARGLGALIPTSAPRPGSAIEPGTVDLRDGTPGGASAARARQGSGTAGQDHGAPTRTATPSAPATSSTPAPQDGLAPVPGMELVELPLTAIRTNPRQPRQVFDPDALDELVHSLREIGLLQPIVVRRVEPDSGSAARFELVAGERRLRASALAGFESIPALVRETTDDALLRDALLENLHRAQLNPLEEGAAYQQLLADFGCTQEELATRLGRSRPQISNSIRLLRLPTEVGKRVAAGVLTAGHARALLSLGDDAAIERMAQRIVNEGLSVRATEEAVSLATSDGSSGRPGSRGARARAQAQPPVELAEAARRLGDRLDTTVEVRAGKGRGAARGGELIVRYADIEDFHRLMTVMGGLDD